MTPHSAATFARKYIKYFTALEEPTEEELTKVNYIVRSDGLWEVRKNKIGIFCTQRYAGDVKGYEEEHSLEEGVKLSLPKIPRKYLYQIISFFKKLIEETAFEAYIQIYWNPELEEYFLNCPKQAVSAGRLEYVASEVDAKNTLVCEIHSHNTMSAFFSGADDDDEKKRGDRFFGVIGNLDTISPTMKLSFIIGGGDRVMIPIEDLFEDESFPQEWLEQVTYLTAPVARVSRKYVTNSKPGYPKQNWSKPSREEEDRWDNMGQYGFRFDESTKTYVDVTRSEQDPDEAEEDVDKEDIYDNMELVEISDFEGLDRWAGYDAPEDDSGDIEEENEKINVMLAGQRVIGSKSGEK